MKELTDEALVREMMGLFGFRSATALLGWATLFGIAGCRDALEMRHARIGSTAARYKAVVKLIELRDHLVTAGYDIQGAPAESAGRMVALATT